MRLNTLIGVLILSGISACGSGLEQVSEPQALTDVPQLTINPSIAPSRQSVSLQFQYTGNTPLFCDRVDVEVQLMDGQQEIGYQTLTLKDIYLPADKGEIRRELGAEVIATFKKSYPSVSISRILPTTQSRCGRLLPTEALSSSKLALRDPTLESSIAFYSFDLNSDMNASIIVDGTLGNRLTLYKANAPDALPSLLAEGITDVSHRHLELQKYLSPGKYLVKVSTIKQGEEGTYYLGLKLRCQDADFAVAGDNSCQRIRLENTAATTSLSLNYCSEPWCYYNTAGMSRIVAKQGTDVKLTGNVVSFNSGSFSLYQTVSTQWLKADKVYNFKTAAKMKTWLACDRIFYDIQYYGTNSAGVWTRNRLERRYASLQSNGEITLDLSDTAFKNSESNDYLNISLNFDSCPQGTYEFERMKTVVQ